MFSKKKLSILIGAMGIIGGITGVSIAMSKKSSPPTEEVQIKESQITTELIKNLLDEIKKLGSPNVLASQIRKNDIVNVTNQFFSINNIQSRFFERNVTNFIYKKDEVGDDIISFACQVEDKKYNGTISGFGKEIRISQPGTLDLKDLQSLGIDKSGSLQGWVLPDDIHEFGDMCFSNINIPSDFRWPSSIQSIGQSGFWNSEFLGDVILPNSLESISRMAFLNSEIHGNFIINNTLKTIETEAFKDIRIHGDVFMNIDFPTSTIGSGIFVDTKIDGKLVISDTFNVIPSDIFKSIDVANGVVIPNTTTTIESNAFRTSKIQKRLELPENINIKSLAFFEATLPTHFVVPSTAILEQNAFMLAKMPANNQWYDENGIAKKDANKGLDVKPGWSIHPDNWTGFQDVNINDHKLTSTEVNQIQNWNSVKWSDSVEEIANDAFKGMTLPSSFVIPETTKYIRAGAFDGVTFEGDVVIYEDVQLIEQNAFVNSTIKGNFIIKSGQLESGIFGNATSKSIIEGDLIIYNDVDFDITKLDINPEVGSGPFSNLEVKGNVTLRGLWKVIPSLFFENITISGKITFPNTLTTIAGRSFSNAILGEINFDHKIWIERFAFSGTTFNSPFNIPTYLVLRDKSFSLIKIGSGLALYNTRNSKILNIDDSIVIAGGWSVY